jgi:DNA primase
MTNWIDFKELRKQLNFADVLQHYGVELKLTGDQHHGFCPLPSHNGKRNSQSFSANVKRGIWQCFGCGEKGNVLDFAVLMERANPENGEDVRQVASKLRELVLGNSVKGEKANESEDENVSINAPLDFELKGLDSTHPYLLDRGFTTATVAHFGLSFCARGLLANRIAIPLHEGDGRLIGYAGRVINDELITDENPKYKFPGRRRRKGVVHEFRKSLFLYNGHRFSHLMVHDLVVVEGFAAVWWLTQLGVSNVVGLMGASCSEEQALAIAWRVLEFGCVWILSDGDPAGKRCATEVFSHLARHRVVRWAKLESGEQPTDFGKKDLKELLPFAVI